MAKMYPMIHVEDINASVAFYRDVLGFTGDDILTDAAGEAMYGDVHWNGADLMFGSAKALSPAARGLLGAGLVLYISDSEVDLDTYCEQVRQRGGQIAEEIADRWWGDRTFSIKDPDGYLLTFAKPVHAFDPSMVPV